MPSFEPSEESGSYNLPEGCSDIKQLLLDDDTDHHDEHEQNENYLSLFLLDNKNRLHVRKVLPPEI